MLVNHYIAEKLWEDHEREWEVRVRRGEFVEGDQPKASFFRRLFSSRRIADTAKEDSHDASASR